MNKQKHISKVLNGAGSLQESASCVVLTEETEYAKAKEKLWREYIGKNEKLWDAHTDNVAAIEARLTKEYGISSGKLRHDAKYKEIYTKEVEKSHSMWSPKSGKLKVWHERQLKALRKRYNVSGGE